MFRRDDAQELGYENLVQVENEVREVILLDITHHARCLPGEVISMLRNDPFGIYPLGNWNPIVTFEENDYLYRFQDALYSAGELMKFGEEILLHPIERLEVVSSINPQTQVVTYYHEAVKANDAGVLVYKPHPHIRKAVSLTAQPRYSAVMYLLSEVFEYLNGMNAFSKVFSNIRSEIIKKDTWVKPEYLEHFYDVPNMTLSNLRYQLSEFVGRDDWNNYAICLRNSTVYVEKLNDYRVVEYYRAIFEKREEERIRDYGFYGY